MSERAQTHIICRANCSDDCLHGKPVDPDEPMAADGTYDPATNSIVCNSCYVAIMPFTPSGKALSHEIDTAVGTLRINRDYLRKHENPDDLRVEAELTASKARPGSSLHRSAEACVEMCKKEIERRKSDGIN